MANLRKQLKVPSRAGVYFPEDKLTGQIDSKNIISPVSEVKEGNLVQVKWGKAVVPAKVLFLRDEPWTISSLLTEWELLPENKCLLSLEDSFNSANAKNPVQESSLSKEKRKRRQTQKKSHDVEQQQPNPSITKRRKSEQLSDLDKKNGERKKKNKDKTGKILSSGAPPSVIIQPSVEENLNQTQPDFSYFPICSFSFNETSLHLDIDQPYSFDKSDRPLRNTVGATSTPKKSRNIEVHERLDEMERLLNSIKESVDGHFKHVNSRIDQLFMLLESQSLSTVHPQQTPLTKENNHQLHISSEQSASPSITSSTPLNPRQLAFDDGNIAIGGVPGVILSKTEYEESMRWGKAPKCTIVLAEKLFGLDELKNSTVTGKKNTRKLEEKVMNAIKAEIIKKFAPKDEIIVQEQLWRDCLGSIGRKCRELRYERM